MTLSFLQMASDHGPHYQITIFFSSQREDFPAMELMTQDQYSIDIPLPSIFWNISIYRVADKIIYIYVKFNAMRKLGSSPIACEDFSVPGGITNGVSV